MVADKTIKKIILISALFTTSIHGLEESKYTYALLSKSRSAITYPDYNQLEKRNMLDQMRLVLDEIFVHGELKLEHFGSSANHTPRLDRISNKLETIDTSTFHAEMADVIYKLQDLHTSYHYPKPHACYRSFLPISFKEALNSNASKVVAVHLVNDKPEVLNLLSTPLSISPGDILRSIDGIPVYELIEANKAISSGANSDAITQRAVGLLSSLNHRSYPLPFSDSVELAIQSLHGNLTTFKVPWITRADDNCLSGKELDTTPLTGEELGMFEDQIEHTRIFRQNPKKKNKSSSTNPLIETSEPSLKYRILQNAEGNFGHIKLDSFKPEIENTATVISLIQDLLEEELSSTDGLIFDVRDNGGGYINLAEGIIQLFTPKDVLPLLFRMRNSPANLHHVETWGSNNLFLRSLRLLQGTSAIYSESYPLNNVESVNSRGQSYFRPVVVFNNARCYSSCDMFSALMQDHGAALIVGEDMTTGAGGANNTDYNATIATLASDNMGPFIKLPGKQNIGFSIRQSLRRAPRENQLIEDTGVIADISLPPQLNDFSNDSEIQFLEISKLLNSMSSSHLSWLKTSSTKTEDITLGQLPTFNAQWENIDTFKFRGKNGDLGIVNVESSNSTGRQVELPTTISTTTLSQARIEILGFDQNKRVARKLLSYRVVPSFTTLPEFASYDVDLSSITNSPLAIYNWQANSSDGWSMTTGMLKIGQDIVYNDNVTTDASLFVELPEGQEMILNVEFEVNTEANFDFFSIHAINNSNSTVIQESLSGVVPMAVHSYDLSQFKGKKTEIKLSFRSDAGVTSQGVLVKKMTLTPKE